MNRLFTLIEKHFAALLLSVLFLVVLGVYVRYNLAFLERLQDLIMGGVLTATVGSLLNRRQAPPDPTVNVEELHTESLNLEKPDKEISE